MSSRLGTDPPIAPGVERRARIVQLGGPLGAGAERDMEDVAALEVAGRAHAPVAQHPLDRIPGDPGLGERGPHLVFVPDIEAALLALGVGVERRVEASLGPPHLPQRPVERLLADPAPALLAHHLPAMQVGAREQRVVVEHLLEVGDEPGGVHRVAVEPASELVVDAAVHHLVERQADRVVLAAVEQELEGARRRELGRAAEAPVGTVEGGLQRRDRLRQDRCVERLLRLLDPADGAE